MDVDGYPEKIYVRENSGEEMLSTVIEYDD